MRKKYLSALLFGALLVTSAGTFTSCKDYDDDINNLQEQITANADAIKALQEVVNNGDYVTGVKKSEDGKGIVFTFSKSGEKVVTLDVDGGQQGDVFSIDPETGELLKNNEPTGIKPVKDAEKAPVKAENGIWMFLNEDGEYESTGIPVSGVSVVGDDQNGYTMTIISANGDAQEIFVPGAASLITSISLEKKAGATNLFNIAYAKFNSAGNDLSSWKGEAELPQKNSVIFTSSELNVRINPVDAPATEVDYTLVNSKNQDLSNVVLKASSTEIGDGLTIGNANSRAAYNGNGLYTLSMKPAILTPSAGEAFLVELDDEANAKSSTQTDVNACIAYAVNANKSARSNYEVALAYEQANAMTKVKVKDINNSEAVLYANKTALGANKTEISIDMNKTYTISNITNEVGYLYDMYFEISTTDKTNFGVEYDNLSRTFKATKRPDVDTRLNVFKLYVHTIDITGTVKVACYEISLTNKITADVVYDPIAYDLTKLDSDNTFKVNLDKVKEAVSGDYEDWINAVELSQTNVTIYKDEKCKEKVQTLGNSDITDGLKYSYLDADGNSIEAATGDIADVKEIKFTVEKGSSTQTIKLSPNTQYYAKVTLNDENTKEVSTFVVPVTFDAPSVAEQFSISEGYKGDAENSVKAFYYKQPTTGSETEADLRKMEVNHFFSSFDKYSQVSLDVVSEVVKVDGISYNSSALAAINSANISNAQIALKNIKTDNNTGCQLGYGKSLIIHAVNSFYSNTGWKFAKDEEKVYSFVMNILSPIFEGTISAADGTTNLTITGNNESGFLITKGMINLIDYNKNSYNVIPDKEGNAVHGKNNSVDVWSSLQLKNVYANEEGTTNYVNKFELIIPTFEENGDLKTEGAIKVVANPLSNTVTDAKISINVKDAWGYTKTQILNTTIEIKK